MKALTLLLAFLFVGAPPIAGGTEKLPSIEGVFGLELSVGDLERAKALYAEALGFEPLEHLSSSASVTLELSGLRLVLVPRGVEERGASSGTAQVSLNLRVGDALLAAERAAHAGARLLADAPRPMPLGVAFPVADPWGNSWHLIELSAEDDAPDSVDVFNVGLTFEEYGVAEGFTHALGFDVFSRDYLPTALPLQRRGAAALVLHATATGHAVDASARLMLACEDLDDARQGLVAAGLLDPSREPIPGFAGRSLVLDAPSGIECLVVERAPARLAFERFASLAGEWRGRSTLGWENRVRFEVIARGSVVMQTSDFDAHPGEIMVTTYRMDGPRLVLTHSCVARNQPYLAATVIADDASSVEFEFEGGTGLVSRDTGHMDRARFQFEDDGTFRSRWSWYQAGRESWMEAIEYRRGVPGQDPSSPSKNR